MERLRQTDRRTLIYTHKTDRQADTEGQTVTWNTHTDKFTDAEMEQ